LTKAKDTGKQARRFAWALLIIGSALASLSLWRGHTTRAEIAFGVGALAPVLAYALPRVWLAFFAKWMQLAEVLSWISTRVILTVFFFLVLTPYAFLLRLIGKAPLDVAWKDGRKTYWIDKPEMAPDLKRYHRAY